MPESPLQLDHLNMPARDPEELARLFVEITIYSTIISAGLSLLTMATASLTRNARYAGLVFACWLWGSSGKSATSRGR